MKKSNYAFTLIELLVAIAIIGILAGVVLVSMSSYAKRARETAALQIASSVMPAAMQCALRGQSISGNSSPIGGDASGEPKPSTGQTICSGSSFTWPDLNTSSTKGYRWANAGESGGKSWYHLCSNSSCSSGEKRILCPVTFTGWAAIFSDDNILPGICTIKSIP